MTTWRRGTAARISSVNVWPIYPSYEIFGVDFDGGPLVRLTQSDG